MKKILLSCFLIAGFAASAQVTGSKTIGVDYPTLNDAFTDLNATGVGAGGATINIPAGYTENAPVGGYLLGNATLNATLSSGNPLVIQKSGSGADPIFYGAAGVDASGSYDGAADAIFKLIGVDYVTIDGLNIQDSASNTTEATLNERGIGFYNLSTTDGCQYNTIKNNTITFLKAIFNVSYGISFTHYSAAAVAQNPTSVDGTHSYNKIYSNTVINATEAAVRLSGFSSATFYDIGNDIGGSSASTANTFQMLGAGDDGFADLNTAGIQGLYQNTLNASYNNISYTNNGFDKCGVRLVSIASSSATVNNNTINIPGGSPYTGYTNYMAGIYNTGATSSLVANNNKITIGTVAGNSTTTLTYGIYQGGTGAFTAQKNTISIGTTTYGYQGIASSSVGAIDLSGNTIFGTTSITASIATGAVRGIYLAATGTTANIIRNKIYDLNASGATGTTSGIYINANTANSTVNIVNNIIGNLKTTAASATTVSLSGIYFAASTNNTNYNVYYNSIYLNGTSTGANFNSSGIYHTYANSTTVSVLDLKNNIIVNLSTPNGTGTASAFRRSAATNLSNYATTSNNNDFAVGAAANSAVYYNGTTRYNYAAFLTAVTARETASLNVNPAFTSTSGSAAGFLHINENSSDNSTLDNKGMIIATYTTDFDNQTRSATPDMGAVEFTYVTPVIAPNCAVINSPVSGSTTVYPGTVNIAWDSVPGAAAYKIYAGTTPGGNELVNGISVNSTSYDLSAPNALVKYYVKVVATNAVGDATGCTEIDFTTTYCQITGSAIFPIYNVTLNGASETSTVVSTYVDISNNNTKTFEVNRGNTFPISLSIAGTTTTTQIFASAIFVDWNQDGDFDDAGEAYYNTVGTLLYGGGAIIPLAGTFTPPITALLGTTRMRVKSAYNTNSTSVSSYLANGCSAMLNGQVKDYTINVVEFDPTLAAATTAVKSTVSVYPNPFQDVLNISDVKGVKSISVSDVSGRQVKNLKPSAQLDLSGLKTGLYIVTLQMEDGTVKSIKAVKK